MSQLNREFNFIRGNLLSNEFWELGMGEPRPVSGIHGTGNIRRSSIQPKLPQLKPLNCAGLGDLMDDITTKHMTKISRVLKENATNIAFIGRLYLKLPQLNPKLQPEPDTIYNPIYRKTERW